MASPLGHDAQAWRRASEELALPALAVPEAYGGLGFGPLELCAVLEETGRALWCGPLLATTVLGAGTLLASGDDDACARWLPGIAAGECVATLAHHRSGVLASRRGAGWALTGEQPVVVAGDVADLLLVPAQTAEGQRLFAVEGPAAGLHREPRLTVDLTRRVARLRLEDVEAVPVGRAGAADEVVRAVLDTAAVALAVEGVGAAHRLLELALDHARQRVQFGRRIGSFQAVKHALVDTHVDLELARSVGESAAYAWATGAPDLPLLAAFARSFCSEVAVTAAVRCTQVFGGTGFTWEHPAHLYLKRVKGSALLLDPAGRQRARLAEQLGLAAAGGRR